MNTLKKITKNTGVVHTNVGVYTISMGPTSASWENLVTPDFKFNWEADPHTVLGKKVVAYGQNNDLPVMIRNIMDDNNLAPGILEREKGLLYGEGPQLYRLVFKDGDITREYVTDPEVWQWLQSFNYRRFIEMAMVEYKYLKGFFVRRYLNRGLRIGSPGQIVKLDVVPAVNARMEYPENGEGLEDVKTMYVGDFERSCFKSGITSYPVFDPANPFRHKVSMSYHCSYSYARNYYPVPSYFGSLNWIKRSSDIPEILKYLTDNGIATAFHVHSPAGYWEEKLEKLRKMYPDKPDDFIEKKLDELKDLTFKKMTEVLAGKKNAGKFIETVDFYDDDRNLCEWKIESIDQKIGDFIEAQLKVAEKADSATTSGLGLHPSLSNIIVNGQLSSGSQMLYALKLYLASDVTIPEGVIFEALNQAIAINFPGKNVRIGFFHKIVMKEENVNPEERVANKK